MPACLPAATAVRKKPKMIYHHCRECGHRFSQQATSTGRIMCQSLNNPKKLGKKCYGRCKKGAGCKGGWWPQLLNVKM